MNLFGDALNGSANGEEQRWASCSAPTASGARPTATPWTPTTAFAVGQAVTHVLKKQGHTTRVIIGKDTRISGYMLESALESGVTSMGGVPYLVGVLPTPGIAFITESMRADAGMVISASHNPYQDNGIKIFSGDGFKLSDEQEAEIEELILGGKLPEMVPAAAATWAAPTGWTTPHGRYIVFLKNTFPRSALDGGHEDRPRYAPTAPPTRWPPTRSPSWAPTSTVIHNTPDGLNINDELRLAAHRGPDARRWWRPAPPSVWPSTATATG